MALIEGARDQSVEKWFSAMEGAFTNVARRLLDRDKDAPPPMEFSLAVLCAVSFGYRSGFELKEIERLFREDDKFKALVAPEEDAHLLAVENMVNVISREAERYRKATYVYDLSAPLVVCDRPLGVLGDMALLPLGPTSVLQLEEAPGATEFCTGFAQAKADSEALVETINQLTVNRARKWVAAASREQLERIVPQVTLEAVADRRSKDSVEYTPPEKMGRKLWWEVRGRPAIAAPRK